MSIHNLKIQRQPFEDLVSGRKTGEVRNCADREFREGDHVELFLIDETGNPANKSIVRTITHIQRGYGLPDDVCVLSYAAPVGERPQCCIPTPEEKQLLASGDYTPEELVRENSPLLQMLNAAEQRIAELLVMLRQAWVDECVSAADCRKIDAALNPKPEAGTNG